MNKHHIEVAGVCLVLLIAWHFATRNTHWIPVRFVKDQSSAMTNSVGIGLRSDGVVVWREP